MNSTLQTPMAAIVARELSARLGEAEILHDITLALPSGRSSYRGWARTKAAPTT